MDINQVLKFEFIDESTDMLSHIGTDIVRMETNPNDKELIEDIFRPIHSIKGNSSFFGYNKLKDFAHVLENLLDDIRKDKLPISPDLITILLRGIDVITAILDNARDDNDELTGIENYEALLDEVKNFNTSTKSETILWDEIAVDLSSLNSEFPDHIILKQLLNKLKIVKPDTFNKAER
ncbi:MAG: Hpt domain-containing protein, partial [Lentisphaeria bacterium]|nr:Hpt domain-containing protein [Lentisphaeria bacterium]NQZ70405.1 Hpt domain-containing protein [Lentisphaeria bacterium]